MATAASWWAAKCRAAWRISASPAAASSVGGVIETTGAGDTFCASVLSFVLEHGLDGLSGDDLHAMLRFANTAAYLVTTGRGAIPAMPDRQQVEALLAAN